MQINQESFNEIKRTILKNRFAKMNDMQKKAIFKVNGPVLILAGAGSGKTTVLVNRIANMLNFGNAYHDNFIPEDVTMKYYDYLNSIKDSTDYDVDYLKESLKVKPISPWNILAITFTNKAANELKSRLQAVLGDVALDINAGTFHSVCLRILRREISRLGFSSSFTIYDTDDSVRTIKDCLSDLSIDDKMFPAKAMLKEISQAKDSMISPEEYLKENSEDFRKKKIGEIYSLYQKKLKFSNAVDFDDIICFTVKLLMDFPDVLTHYQNLYKYILVDEYQDTNHVQYKLVSLLSQKSQNICVVGDDDQSIYKFRGATIENILNFEKEFEDATVIRLEQNYRSTQNILDAANSIIKNNSERKGKNLWTAQGEGDKVVEYRCPDENSEAQFVTKKITESIENGLKFSDNAVLYRMNAQSANIERHLVKSAIPYRIVGGTKFYERKEIKDILAYFHILDNPYDRIRLKRIINEPKRGIGDTTVKNVEAIADKQSVPMYVIMKSANEYDLISKKSSALMDFTNMIDDLTKLSNTVTLADLLDELLERTNYGSYLRLMGKEGEARLENVDELKSNLIKYSQENEDATLQGFLEEVSLYTDLDNLNTEDDKVTLMTMHSAKGLEFNNVYIVGMEENIFPSFLSASSETELQEERRLAYVAVTRAKEHLYISNSAQRMLFGRTSRNMPSRFLKEIPESLVEIIDETVKAYGYLPRREKPKPVYKPEIKGVVGVRPDVEKAVIDFAVNDNVHHKMFGNGVVKSMTKMSNDTLVEIDFDKVGKKKIMANFAKLEKI